MVDNVSFGQSKLTGILGMIIGCVIAIGVPFVVFEYGSKVNIGSTAATILSIIGILGGVTVAVIATFFSIVIPSKVAHHAKEKETISTD